VGSVTGPKINKIANNKAAYADLDKALGLAGGVTPCRESSLFTTPRLSPGDARIAGQVCDSCPIISACRAAGQALSAMARANSVMGGVVYDDDGKPVSRRQLAVIARTSQNVVAKTDVEAAA
jgi:hypothetical protein